MGSQKKLKKAEKLGVLVLSGEALLAMVGGDDELMLNGQLTIEYF